MSEKSQREKFRAERERFERIKKESKLPWETEVLAAGVAHEFNNILGAAAGHAEWALESGDVDEMREALEVTLIACKRSSRITKALQGLAQPKEEARNSFSLSEIKTDLEKLFSSPQYFDYATLKIELDSAPIEANSALVFEIFVNLIKNSFESVMVSSSPKEKSWVDISVLSEDSNWVKVLVDDSGEAIPPIYREEIFKPFFSNKGSMAHLSGLQTEEGAIKKSPVSGGSGLGLFLVQIQMLEMGGSIVLREEGKGFVLSFPCAK